MTAARLTAVPPMPTTLGVVSGAAKVASSSSAKWEAAAISASVGGSVCRKRSVRRTAPASRLLCRRTSRPCAQNQFRAAAADVEDEQQGVGGQVQAVVGADGGVGELRLAVAGDDLDVHPGLCFGLCDEVRAVGGVAQGARACRQDPFAPLRAGGLGEALNGVQRSAHGRVAQTLGGVHAFAQARDFGVFGDDGQRAVFGHVGDGHLGGVGADVNGGKSHGNDTFSSCADGGASGSRVRTA